MVIAVVSLARLGGRRAARVVRLGRRRARCSSPRRATRRTSFAERVAAAASPIDDVRGSAAYRRHALRVLDRARAREDAAHEDLAARQRRRGARPTAGRASRCSSRCARSSASRARRTRASRASAARARCCSTGTLVCACLVLAAQADGHDVTTVEGLADGERLHRGAGGVRRGGRRAVRLLHAGPRRRGRRPARAHAGPVGRRDPRGALRQPLPLHRLRRRSSTRCGWRRRSGMTQAAPRHARSVGRIGESVRARRRRRRR